MNLFMISVCGILLSTAVFWGFLTVVARQSADEASMDRLDDAQDRILANNEKLKDLSEITEEDSLSRARALTILIEMEPDIIRDSVKLEEIADALDVDEIHIIDENGVLQWGTQPFRYGMQLADSEQTRPFLSLLDDPAIEISQAPILNASLGVVRQYAGVSLRHTKGIAMVGVIPSRMLDALENTRMEDVLRDVVLGNTGYLFSISNDTGLISSHPNEDLVGTRLAQQLQESGFMEIDGQRVLYHTRSMPGEILISAFPTSEMYRQRTLSTGFFFIFTVILFILFCGFINLYIKKSIVSGIHDILDTLGRITDGDLDVVADVRSSIEFSKLSDGINHMLSSIKAMIDEVSQAVTAAEEASRAKSTFLASMSHEIRTPMNAIIGMTELLLNEQLTSRQKGYVDDISVSSHALLSIINDILDLSKIEAGKMELVPVDYDFGIFLDNIASVFRFVVEKKGLEFKFEKVGELPGCLQGDDIRLRQVLTNLCGNAAKFTTEGYIRLRVTSGDETIIFEIEDTGMGIHKDELPKLFDAFSQADTRKNRSITGTGLGLPISKSFVEMMGGSITVYSEYGKGTVFSVVIPKVLGDADALRYEITQEPEKALCAPSAKVLVVDDNEVNLRVASGLLSLYQIKADTAPSGKDAIQCIQRKDYHIVFMDHMMPEMDGIETTREIRKLGGKYEDLIIIALTANAIRGAREMFLANGFHGFISKPIEIEELTGVLREWLPSEKPHEKAQIIMPEKQDGFMEKVKGIAGINTEIGLSRVSGLVYMYRETMELFYERLLAECEKMEGQLHRQDLHNLTVSVHGMKSSLATIGMMGLADTALALEMAAKEKRLDDCAENLPGFLASLRRLYEELTDIIPQEKAPLARPAGQLADMREWVEKVLEAADDFDADLACESMDKLLAYDFGQETNTLLDNAAKALKSFDFDTAVERLHQLLA